MSEPTRTPPRQIEAVPFKDYVSKPDKGAREPIVAPGGWLALIAFAAIGAYGYFGSKLLRPLTEPVGAWVTSLFQ
jgi:hypothetical protein